MVAGFLFAILSVCSLTQAHVLDGAKEWNGHYYKNFEFKLKWENAKKFCESVGGHLATVENDYEIEILSNISKNGSDEYWIGGYKDNNGIWKWITGSVITGNHWREGAPYKIIGNYTRNNEMYISKYSDKKWQNMDGTAESYAFICEWESRESAHESTM